MPDATTLRRRFDALSRAYPPGQHGRWAAQQRAEALDRWFGDAFASTAGAAVVALGGYGRRSQLPVSDVDVLIVHAELDEDTLSSLGERLWYPLWDRGWTVTPLVRTPSECATAAVERLDSCTAMLDGRLVAGDEVLFHAAIDPVVGGVRDDVAAFAERLASDRDRRRTSSGSCGVDLAPDLKEGIGGLRDVAIAGWLATAVGTSLADAGLVRQADGEAIDAADEFLVRARSALQLETGKRLDRLSVDLQPEVAASMGFVDEPGLAAIDALMRTVFDHARAVDAAVSGALARLRVDEAREAVAPIGGPADALTAIASAARARAGVAPTLLDAIGSAPIPDPVAWDDAVRDGFLAILRAGDAGAEAFAALDRLGVLERFVPAWRDVRSRPQRDPYHRFTVDAHLIAAMVSIDHLLAGGADDPFVADAVAAVSDHDAVRLGAFFHDIGKVGRGDHVPAGATIAREQLARMRLPEPTAELSVFLVAEHLLLPDTATRRDLSDENLIIDVAARVGTVERLGALTLLAVADAEATGPAARTPWRQALLRELVTKVRHVLERGAMDVELAERLTERIGAVRALLTDEPERDVDAFVLRMPRGYFLSVDPGASARHFHTIAPFLGSTEVRTAAVRGQRPDTYELLVVTGDRPALLAAVAGALAVGGISILSAQVFTTSDHVAVDLFEVEGAFEPEITEERWRSFRTTLRRVVEGAISIDRKVAETRRHYPGARVATPVTVRVDNDASDFSTVFEVGAPDRMGLLYDITDAFATLALDVHLAKVVTFDGRVVDAFYVQDELGRKVFEPDRLAEIETAVRARLG